METYMRYDVYSRPPTNAYQNRFLSPSKHFSEKKLYKLQILKKKFHNRTHITGSNHSINLNKLLGQGKPIRVFRIRWKQLLLV